MTAAARMRPRRLLAVCLALMVLLAACSSTGGDGAAPGGEVTPSSPAERSLQAQVASFDLAVGDAQRLLVGLFTADRGLVGGGSVTFRLAALGEEPAPEGSVELGAPVTADFLPVPGSEPATTDAPTVIEGAGAGVYAAEVDLPEPGFWVVQAEAEVEGRTLTAQASFEVLADPEVPAVGDPAPRTEAPTIGAAGVDPATIDSRARDGAEIPDAHLHDTTVAAAIDAGRPVVVVVSTPVYCASRFCGPITETVADLAGSYDDRAAFVHLEVWASFEDQQLNDAAAQWIQTPSGGNEPWVFLVGADGTIRARWDNVLDVDELRGLLEALPA